jgi:hypothetical protein
VDHSAAEETSSPAAIKSAVWEKQDKRIEDLTAQLKQQAADLQPGLYDLSLLIAESGTHGKNFTRAGVSRRVFPKEGLC